MTESIGAGGNRFVALEATEAKLLPEGLRLYRNDAQPFAYTSKAVDGDG